MAKSSVDNFPKVYIRKTQFLSRVNPRCNPTSLGSLSVTSEVPINHIYFPVTTGE